MDCRVSGFPVLQYLPSLPKFMSIELVMPSNCLILCRPLLLLPSIFPSIRVFSNESALCIRWPKYWSFSFNISPSNEHPGLISFQMDWLDLLAVQETLKSLLQHRSSKASILRSVSHSVVPDSLQPHGLQPARLLCPWDSPGKNTEVGCHFLLWEIFPTQGSNPGLLQCWQILYHLSYRCRATKKSTI